MVNQITVIVGKDGWEIVVQNQIVLNRTIVVDTELVSNLEVVIVN